ncbi:MAG TPA: inositol monophosphatase family protein [Chloroflexota bacterium]
MPESYARALETAIGLAREAGALLRAEFHRPGGPRGGRGHAPADDEAEALIRRGLLAAFPDWGYRGEETRPHLPAQDAAGHVWLVDPNDGTAAFLRGQRGSAVSIGLVRGGVPVLGVVYAFCAPDDAGDFFAWAEGCGPPRRNDIPLPPLDASATLDAHTVVLISQGADRRASDNLQIVAPARFRALPSIAYRLALAAAGEGTAASLHTPGDWDYGGGHALVRGVGGVFINERTEEVSYAPDGASRVGFCFGGPPRVCAELAARSWQPIFEGAPVAWPDPSLPFDFLRLAPGENVADAGLLSRAQGCLLGQIAGDALGALVEFQSARRIAASYPDGGPRLLADGGPHAIIAGQPTDDSELALLLARSIVDHGGFDAAAVAAAYGWWYHGVWGEGVSPSWSPPFDIGGTTATALSAITPQAIADHAAVRVALRAAAAASASSQANGALMRASPIGIWGGLGGAAATAAAHDAALTHPHPACRAASATLVTAIGHAVSRGTDAQTTYEATLAWVRSRPDAAPVHEVIEASRTAPPADYERQQGWVLIALQNAFYQLLHAPSLEDGVVATVRAGGDTDTNGAICGALLGAVYGRDALPAQWRQMVLSCRATDHPPTAPHPRPRPLWPTDALALAERLLLAGHSPDQ